MSIEAERMGRLRALHAEMHALLAGNDFAAVEIDAYADRLAESLGVLYPGLEGSIARRLTRYREQSRSAWADWQTAKRKREDGTE